MKRSFPFAMCALLALGACSHLPTWMGGSTAQKPKVPGERTAVLPVSGELQPDPAVQQVPFALPSPARNSQWAQHSQNLTAGTANLALLGDLTQKTSANAGEGDGFEHTLIPRPVVGGGMVFAMDAEGHISAHEAGNIGNVKWVSEGVYEDNEQDNMGGGLAYDNGRLYATSGRGMLAALDAATGQPIWKALVRIPFRSAPKVGEGKVFAITIDDQLYALDANNGTVLWTHRGMSEQAGVMNNVSPTLVTGAVIVPYTSGEIYMLATGDGSELWNTSVSMHKRTRASDLFTGIGGDPVVDGQVLFAVSNGSGFGVMGLEQGQPLWSRPTASFNTPWVVGDYVYLLTTDATLVCMLKYDGRVRWATQLQAYEDMERKVYPITWHGPLMVGGKVAVISSLGELVLADAATGAIESTLDAPDDVYTTPVVAEGVMYLIDKNATLYALQ